MLKTCGTTTLLRCIPTLLSYASQFDMEVDYVVFSRKNFLFPQEQQFPHTGWNHEVEYLNEFFDGHAFVYGPLSAEHWFLYVADYTTEDEPSGTTRSECTLEIMMHRMDHSVTPQFYRREGTGDHDKMPGIAELLPGSETDEFNFTPCGYSMNGLRDEAYWTIHVTPENHCSYASFETNVRLVSSAKLAALVQRVVSVFRPGVMTIALFTSDKNNAKQQLELPGYVSRHRTVTEMEFCGAVTVWNLETQEVARERGSAALARKSAWRAGRAINRPTALRIVNNEEEEMQPQAGGFSPSKHGYLHARAHAHQHQHAHKHAHSSDSDEEGSNARSSSPVPSEDSGLMNSEDLGTISSEELHSLSPLSPRGLLAEDGSDNSDCEATGN